MLYWTPKFVTQDGSFILWYSNNFSFSPFFSFFFLFPYFLPACNDGQLLAKVGQVSGCSGRQKMEPPPSSPLICPKSTKRNYSKHAERHKTLQFLLLLEQFFFPSFLSLSLSLSCRERGAARVLLGASSFPRFIGAPVITTAFNFCSLFCGLLFFLLFFFFLSFLSLFQSWAMARRLWMESRHDSKGGGWRPCSIRYNETVSRTLPSVCNSLGEGRVQGSKHSRLLPRWKRSKLDVTLSRERAGCTRSCFLRDKSR